MSKKVTVPVHLVRIRRDAQTTTKTNATPYELPILRLAHGKDNVVDEGQEGVREVDPAAEYERLVARFGPEKVVKVHGEEESGRVAELVEKSAVAGERRTAQKSDDDAKGTGGSKGSARARGPAAGKPQAGPKGEAGGDAGAGDAGSGE